MITLSATLLLAASWAYLGFQGTIRVLVYPQLRRVPGPAFAAFELAHQRSTSVVVGPLFAALLAAGAFALAANPGPATAVVGACIVLILADTAFVAVPAHRRLSHGFDQLSYRRLLHADSARLGLAIIAAGTAAWHLLIAT